MLCRLDGAEPFWVRCFHNCGSPPPPHPPSLLWINEASDALSTAASSLNLVWFETEGVFSEKKKDLLAASSIFPLDPKWFLSKGWYTISQTISCSPEPRKDVGNQKTFVRALVWLKLVVNYTWPLSASFLHYVSFLYMFLQPSSCCSTWFSTVSWLVCSPWPCGCCCSLWTTLCPSTETASPPQVSFSQHTVQGRERGFQLL